MRLTCLVGFLIFSVYSVYAQKPFANEIESFKKGDSLSFPGTEKILFVGSSSFRMWKDLQKDFPNHEVINRGFGGSTLPDVLLYKEDLIGRYQPKQVVIYCGENDLAGGTSPASVAENFKSLFHYIREVSPDASVVYVSIKPSPSRDSILPEVRETNRLISGFLATQENASFVDVFSPMIRSNGSIRKDLFLKDMLHMNRKGYAIWQQAIAPHLK